MENDIQTEQPAWRKWRKLSRRRVFALAAISLAIVILLVCLLVSHPSKREASLRPERTNTNNTLALREDPFLVQAGNSLIALHQTSQGGWEFQSQIQAPHYQTDRDVGAASVGMGFLVLANRYPHDQQWLTAAEQTATWLMAVSTKGSNGAISWSDYVDGGDDSSNSVYTSFDDGALGIGDFFWRLYQETGNPQYKSTALGTVNWTLAQAENVGSTTEPAYRWPWDTSTRNNALSSDNPPIYYMGMGEGSAGIINTLTTYYQRTETSDPVFAAQCKQYIDGGLRYLQQTQAVLGQNGGDNRAVPETGVIGQDGDTAMNAGYLSGAAGAAYMYLNLYNTFDDQSYLAQANKLFSWLQDTNNGPMVEFNNGTVAWRIAIDPDDSNDPTNAAYATGFEEGSAGIGWTYLQAYELTHDQQYLAMAKRAAGWLLSVAVKDNHNGYSWHEDENPASPYVRPNLDNGAAGIGMFFYDLYLVTKDQSYLTAAQGARQSIVNTAVHSGNNVYWQDDDDGSQYSNDPSWHWGDAGIIDFMARLSGGTMDIPGEQDGLTPRS